MRVSAVDFRGASGSRLPGCEGCKSGVISLCWPKSVPMWKFQREFWAFIFLDVSSPEYFILQTPTTKLTTDEYIGTVRYLELKYTEWKRQIFSKPIESYSIWIVTYTSYIGITRLSPQIIFLLRHPTTNLPFFVWIRQYSLNHVDGLKLIWNTKGHITHGALGSKMEDSRVCGFSLCWSL